jgi:hypothetical protein
MVVKALRAFPQFESVAKVNNSNISFILNKKDNKLRRI